MDIIIGLILAVILIALGMGLYFLYHDSAKKTRALHALMWRVGLAVFLIVFLIFAVWMGWIHPHPVGH